MTIFLKRFFLLFFIITAYLFMVYLMIPEAAHAHTTGLSGVQQQADTPTATTVPTTAPTITPTATATATPTPTPTATIAPTPIPPMPVATTEPTPVPTATATPTPAPTSTVVPPTTPPGGNTNSNSSHTALNYVIFAMGSVGVLMVIVGVILYFVYARPG